MKSWRKWVMALHRDLGYFFAGVIVLYSISGLAVNHAGKWDPSFIINRQEIALDLPSNADDITREQVLENLEVLGAASNYKSFDFPSPHRVKIYLEDGSIMARLGSGTGTYETIRRRPLLYEANFLHLNPKGWWRTFSDLFSAALIIIAVTGLILARGHRGLAGRGKWFVGAGLVAPLAALLLT